MKIYQFGGYTQIIKENITCTCRHGSVHINNYKNGEKICKHIKRVIKMVKCNE